MPEDAYICCCMGIKRADIFRAVDQGARDLDKLIEITGANEGCGTCINELYACLEQALSTYYARQEESSQAQQLFPFVKIE